jgi:hypothetical protein
MTDNIKRTLDWTPQFDERSKDYPIRTFFPAVQHKTFTLWNHGEILDQGSEGACVGFGWTAEALAGPVHVDLKEVNAPKASKEPNKFAYYVYREAQKVDQWPGTDYEGTSVLAGAKIMSRYGIIHQYRWAFGINDVIGALMSQGPVVLGINWHSGMYDAPGGRLTVTGPRVGGHAILAIGYNPSSILFEGKETVILQNSWGNSWGVNGIAEITVEDLDNLLKQRGEACVPLVRGFGPELKKVPIRSQIWNRFLVWLAKRFFFTRHTRNDL